MCTNYKAPGDDPGISELKIGISDLYRRDPWDLDVYPDYAAPVAYAVGNGLEVVKAVFGFWPKFMQPEDYDEWLNTKNVEAARAMLQLYPADEMESGSKQS